MEKVNLADKLARLDVEHRREERPHRRRAGAAVTPAVRASVGASVLQGAAE
jgi:hypothetical protein